MENEHRQKNEFDEAFDNIKEFNMLELEEDYIFKTLLPELVSAFDKETTFDMRVPEQVELLKDRTSLGITNDKDGNIYPYIMLTMLVRDWNPTAEKVCRFRKGTFVLTLKPFDCSLEKYGEKSQMYNGADAELTNAWRNLLKQEFAEAWEDAYKQHKEKLELVSDNKSVVEIEKQ